MKPKELHPNSGQKIKTNDLDPKGNASISNCFYTVANPQKIVKLDPYLKSIDERIEYFLKTSTCKQH